ncbi:hypothetical protein QUB68_12535 [Microcoleus sp. A006_D1]|uniref:hypothetical protein n=1 Tax=Microcoleus sp. A006_D1 TaxID=3055267 RepID=UPI002FD59BA7
MKQIKCAIKTRGWIATDPRWLILASKHLDVNSSRNWDDYLDWKIEILEAEISCLVINGISITTWKRFLKGVSIKTSTFEACCKALDLCWKEIADQPSLGDTQRIVGVQVQYIDPRDYVGLIWTQIVPEAQNINKRHLITINWGSWSWQQIKTIPVQGLLLCYRKRFRDYYARIVTVSTFPDKSANRVTTITNATKIINSHLPI